MDIAEALFQPHDGFAIGGEAEMSGLDDAGMNRSDRDLVQTLSLDGQEIVGPGLAALFPAPERMGNPPEAEIEPGSSIGQAHRLQAVKVGDGALQPDRGGVQRADGGKLAARTFEREDADLRGGLLNEREMHRALVAPKPEHRGALVDKLLCQLLPTIAGDDGVRPRVVRLHPAALPGDVGECGHGRYPSSFATFWNQVTSGPGR